MKKINAKFIKAPLLVLLTSAALPAVAEDWAISATGSCETALGTTVSSGGGLRASGGTAVVKCPLTKESGVADAITAVYARMKRGSASGANSFCTVQTYSNFGTPSDIGYGWSSAHTSNQSVSITLPDQYSYGYADVYCTLVSGDTFYGVRYLQKN